VSDRKEVPVGMGESKTVIRPPQGSLASLLASGDPVATLESRIPEAHRFMLKQMGVRGSDMEVTQRRQRAAPASFQKVEPQPIGVGDELVTVGGKRVVVLKCSVDREQDGTPIHRVVRKKTGDILRISEKKLRR